MEDVDSSWTPNFDPVAEQTKAVADSFNFGAGDCETKHCVVERSGFMIKRANSAVESSRIVELESDSRLAG